MKRNFGLLLPVLITLAGLAVIFYLLTQGIHPAQAGAQAPHASIVVTTLEDELKSDGDCSLREAIEAANMNAPVDACPAGQTQTDTITFAVMGTIVVASQLSVTAGGPLVIDGGGVITTSGGRTTRVWYVETGSELTLQNLNVQGGTSKADGAGMFNSGNVILIHCIFSDNLANNQELARGGGIANRGILSITNSSFYNNRAYSNQAEGGGIDNLGILTITNSTFNGNGAYRILDKYIMHESMGGGVRSRNNWWGMR